MENQGTTTTPEGGKTPATAIYEFQIGDEVRRFTVNSQVSPAVINLLMNHGDTLAPAPGEPEREYGRRLYRWMFGDAARLNEIMRMSLRGDHSGIDWYYNGGNALAMARAFNAFLEAVLPQAVQMMQDLESAE